MAIVLTVAPLIRPFRGYADPALPSAYWAVKSSILGDASGSLMSVDILFSTTGAPANSLMYSLEQLSVIKTGGIPLEGRIDMGLFDDFPSQGSTGAVNTFYALLLKLDPVASGRSALFLNDAILPLWLGAPRKGVSTVLGVDFDNINAVSLSVFAQGFVWNPEAINAEGGPQRPSTSIYGR